MFLSPCWFTTGLGILGMVEGCGGGGGGGVFGHIHNLLNNGFFKLIVYCWEIPKVCYYPNFL